MTESFARKHEEADEEAPFSENERHLSEWFKKCDRAGAIPESRAGADLAYAMGHARGLEEAQDAQLDALRTLVMRVLGAKGGEPDDVALDRIEQATLRELETWVFKLATDT
jgi:hypothetical protein